MVLNHYPSEAVTWYVEDISARVVAESGIATDRFHLGKLIFQGLKDAPDFILQIDGATGKSETFGSVLRRSIGCATALKKLGMAHGANIIIMAPNHLELTIPFYAALYLGLGLGCIDMTLGVNELRDHFECESPKFVFCQSDRAEDVSVALKSANLDARVITFDDNDHYTSLSQLLQDIDENSLQDFKPSDFNTEETVAFLVATSGTTGLSKAAEITHKNVALAFPHWWRKFDNFPTPTRLWLLPSPIQWISAILVYLQTPILRITRLQSSLTMTIDRAINLINAYQPTYAVMNPNTLSAMLNPNLEPQCDFASFELITVGGSAVPQLLLDRMKSISSKTHVCIGYGMSEISGICFMNFTMIPDACGQIAGCVFMRKCLSESLNGINAQVALVGDVAFPGRTTSAVPANIITIFKVTNKEDLKLINPTTEEEITEPNTTGELWLKGPTVFKGYCNNPALTKETFSKDGWFKTGDIFYRDDSWNFYFVDRLKMLLKYKNHQISPVEIENVIRQHSGVAEIAVTGIPHAGDGELPVACVVKQNGSNVIAKEIENMVEEHLSDTKKLRGGVIFFNELPLTTSSKINRAKLKQIVLEKIRGQSH